jgi:hypothetical protein
MDMDPKGKDEANNPTNGGQDGGFISDGVQGMQLAQTEINIGAIKVPLSPSGDSLAVKKLSQNSPFSNCFANIHFRLNDKSGYDPHLHCVTGVSAWGLPQVLSGSGLLSGSAVEKSGSKLQQGRPASTQGLPADGLQAGEPETDTCERVARIAVDGGSSVVTDAILVGKGRSSSAQTICM